MRPKDHLVVIFSRLRPAVQPVQPTAQTPHIWDGDGTLTLQGYPILHNTDKVSFG